jgi:hypothetical protein
MLIRLFEGEILGLVVLNRFQLHFSWRREVLIDTVIRAMEWRHVTVEEYLLLQLRGFSTKCWRHHTVTSESQGSMLLIRLELLILIILCEGIVGLDIRNFT